MQLFEEITGLDGKNLPRLAKNLDLTSDQTAAVLKSIMPEISHWLERKTLSRGGLAEVIQTLGNPTQQEFLKPETDLASPEAVANGNNLLGQILETKYRSRALADKAEAETGVPAAKIRQMLPRVANISMGALSQQTRPGLEDIFKKLPGFPGGQGNTSTSTGSPLPIPGDNWGGGSSGKQGRNSYDDLSDILRRRQGALQSNPLWNIARQILGSVLGFQSKGILGYIIRFSVYRYGWTIVRMIFGKMFRV